MDAAMGLLATREYDEVRLDDIVKAAGMTTGNVYYYFSGKDDLLRQAAEHYAALLTAENETLLAGLDDPIDRLRAAIRGMFDGTGNARRNRLEVASRRAMEHFPEFELGLLPNGGMDELLRRLVEDALAEPAFRLPVGATPTEVARVFVDGFYGVVRRSPAGTSPAAVEAVRLYLRSFLLGLADERLVDDLVPPRETDRV